MKNNGEIRSAEQRLKYIQTALKYDDQMKAQNAKSTRHSHTSTEDDVKMEYVDIKNMIIKYVTQSVVPISAQMEKDLGDLEMKMEFYSKWYVILRSFSAMEKSNEQIGSWQKVLEILKKQRYKDHKVGLEQRLEKLRVRIFS